MVSRGGDPRLMSVPAPEAPRQKPKWFDETQKKVLEELKRLGAPESELEAAKKVGGP
jgi:hypothetical protein